MRGIVAVAVAVAVAAGSSPARADDKDKADKLFKQGKKLMDQKRYADACALFEQSAELDPGIGVELNVARCYEEWGKLALAFKSYVKAERMAKESSDNRLARIRERVTGLEGAVPRLTLRVPDGAILDDAAIKLDNKVVDVATLGKPQLVDPGPHLVEYIVDGAKKTKVIALERGNNSELPLDLPTRAGTTGKQKPDGGTKKPVKEGGSPPAGRNQRIAAYATAGAGAIAMGVSLGLTLSARSAYKNALADHCMNQTNQCDAVGLSLTHSARGKANAATVVFVVGAAAIGGGVALYLTAPRGKRARDEHAVYVAPALGGDGGGVVLGGRF
jgi:tetratricopeptide (TPR) repeat protein